MRHTAAFAVDIETQLALGVLGREIDFARRRIEPFRHDNEMVNQLLHLRHHTRLRRQHIFPITTLIGHSASLSITWRKMRTLCRISSMRTR